MTVGGRPFVSAALVEPHPDIAEICYEQACRDCPSWFVCQGLGRQVFGTVHMLNISQFHFRKRAKNPITT